MGQCFFRSLRQTGISLPKIGHSFNYRTQVFYIMHSMHTFRGNVVDAMRRSFFLFVIMFLSDLITAGESFSQNFVWARQLNLHDTYSGSIVDVAMDEEGNSYITGHFNGSTLFTGFPLVFTDEGGFYLAKINPAGETVWLRTVKGVIGTTAIAYDNNGNICVIGFLEGTVHFGISLVTVDTGVGSYFIAKYTTSGALVWSKIYENAYSPTNSDSLISLSDIACTQSGDILITGMLYNYEIGGAVLNPNTHTRRVFLAQLNDTANTEWAKVVEGDARYLNPTQLTSDPDGNVFLGIIWTDVIGEIIFDAQTTLTGSGFVNSVIAKYDPLGNCLWAQRTSSLVRDELKGLNTDEFGNVYVSRYSSVLVSPVPNSDRFSWLDKLNPSGQSIWTKSGRDVLCRSSVTAKDGNTYMHIGSIFATDSLFFNGFEIEYQEDESAVMKVNTSGTVQWVKYVKSGNGGMRIAASGNGSILFGYGGVSGFSYVFDENVLSGTDDAYFDYAALIYDRSYAPVSNNTITGNIFNDNNSNCLIDSVDDPIEGFSVVAIPGPYYGTSDSLGNYTVAVDTGEYVISQIEVQSHQFTNALNCPVTNEYSVQLHTIDSVADGFDFANNYNLCGLLTGKSSMGESVCCDSVLQYSHIFCNHGLDTVRDVSVEIQYSDRVIPLASSIPWSSYDPLDSIMVLNIGDIPPGSCTELIMIDSVTCTPDTYYGNWYGYDVRIEPQNLCYANDSIFNKYSGAFFAYRCIDAIYEREKHAILIFPNPATTTLRIQLPDNVRQATGICLYDMMGRQVQQLAYSPTIDISPLAKGTYVVVVATEQGRFRNVIQKE
ncbi:MAG: T9SS type A sorting domain-containing protein [Flavobacteriales bacterium]|nr:T9SS type A sorting domain-containing protein [Flavobacteriales bacterium]